ncbi:MAG: zinc ABC transporter substrate-binding protein [Bdellovibrionota bacterium]
MKLTIWAFVFLFNISISKAENKPLVLVSFSVLTNICLEIGKDDFDIKNINSAGSDEHSFEPKPDIIKSLKKAKALILNGLGYEPWFEHLKKDYSGTVLIASKGIEELSFPDPHAWLDPMNGIIYAENIKNLLIKLRPEKEQVIKLRFEAFKNKLKLIFEEEKKKYQRLSNRKVVTSHSSFNYLAKMFNLQFYSPYGVSTDHEASARDLKRVIEIIRKEKINSLFTEYGVSDGIMKTLSNESGVMISGMLYSDKLSDSSGPAKDYLSMIKYNLDEIHRALSAK